MSLPRCPHGNYNSKNDGEPSDYCTGCNPPKEQVSIFELRKLELEWEKRLTDNSSES